MRVYILHLSSRSELSRAFDRVIQHNNGGLAANVWWESNVRHLFPVGEVCGTHGVRRPGGSALNAGQVGALRAARFIAHNYTADPPQLEEFSLQVSDQIKECVDFCARVTDTGKTAENVRSPSAWLAEVQDRMLADLPGDDLVPGALDAFQCLLRWRNRLSSRPASRPASWGRCSSVSAT